jgi:OHCU decarboxylase
MSGGLHRINGAPRDTAIAWFLQCCAVRRWAEAMADARPFADRAALLAAADVIWLGLDERAWRQAFDGHPRIGERKAVAATSAVEQQWSAQEQSASQQDDAAVHAELADAQREYEQRFGHIFLICATGRSATEILTALRSRLNNDPDTELRAAAAEQRRITRLRLEKLLTT